MRRRGGNCNKFELKTFRLRRKTAESLEPGAGSASHRAGDVRYQTVRHQTVRRQTVRRQTVRRQTLAVSPAATIFYMRFARFIQIRGSIFLFRLTSKEALIKSLSDFATSIIMQDKEKDDANSELFKESFDAVLHNYAAKSDSSI